MGASADDFLISQFLEKAAGSTFRDDEADITSIIEQAEDLAATDGMPLKRAVEIASGQTRPPYGTELRKG